MPIFERSDKDGPYFQYGCKKYSFTPGNQRSRLIAWNRCKRHVAAIHASRAWQKQYHF